MAEELLKRSRGKSPTKENTRVGIDLTAIGFGSEEDKDDLKQIDGIGRFVEENECGRDIQDIPNCQDVTRYGK